MSSLGRLGLLPFCALTKAGNSGGVDDESGRLAHTPPEPAPGVSRFEQVAGSKSSIGKRSGAFGNSGAATLAGKSELHGASEWMPPSSSSCVSFFPMVPFEAIKSDDAHRPKGASRST
jgi:hypothetical protein